MLTSPGRRSTTITALNFFYPRCSRGRRVHARPQITRWGSQGRVGQSKGPGRRSTTDDGHGAENIPRFSPMEREDVGCICGGGAWDHKDRWRAGMGSVFS